MISFLEVIDRALTGPISEEKNFDMVIFNRKLKEVVKEYNIEYDPENPVPQDDSLADDLFKAAIEFYSEVGTYSLDTHRRIIFDKEEIKEALRTAHSQVPFGEGKDAGKLLARKPESKIPPWCSVGGAGIQVSSEEILSSLLRAYGAIPLANSITTPSLTTIDGRTILSDSPLEIYGAIKNVTLAKEALKKIGRPGLPIINGVATAISDAATIAGGQFGLKTTDAFEIGSVAEMKVNFAILNRVAYAVNTGTPILGGTSAILGGYCGGPEGTAVANTAYLFHSILVKRASVFHPYPIHYRYKCNSVRNLLWVVSLTSQAISRNTDFPLLNLCYVASGPTTKMCFYETAASVIASVVSGASIEVEGLASSTLDHLSSLEPMFATEVAHSMLGKKRTDANDIVKALLSKYENRIENAPLGKKYQECFDVKSATPSKEYSVIYEQVKKEMEDNGIL